MEDVVEWMTPRHQRGGHGGGGGGGVVVGLFIQQIININTRVGLCWG